jgi:hypothetical protein
MYIDRSTNTQRFEDTSIATTNDVAVDFVETQEDDEIQTNDNLRIFLNEIDMLFEVERLDEALFKRAVDASAYQSFIQRQLKQNSIVESWFAWHVEVKIVNAKHKDIMVVDMHITKRYDGVEDFTPVRKRFVV